MNIDDIERTVFGFLCFDHREVEYFDDNDVLVGKIFADWLCSLVFTRLIYTDMSRTFTKVKQVLGRLNAPLRLYKLDELKREESVTSVEDIREHSPSAQTFGDFVSPPEDMSDGPKLQVTDQELLEFAQSRRAAKSLGMGGVDRRRA